MTDTIYMTKEGQIELQIKINSGEQKLKELILEKAIAYEASGDGWHDNPGWIQIGQLEERMSKEIKEMKERLSNSKLIANDSRNTMCVQIGSIVRISQGTQKLKKELLIEIVGSQESNLSKGKIAYDTPIGKAIMGYSKGDEIDFIAPAGQMKIKILKLYESWESAS
jgi:transcription elongation factor GreA